MKLAVSGLIALIQPSADRQQYRMLYKAVRASGVGDWREITDEVLSGPTLQSLPFETSEARELTERVKVDTWQFESVSALDECLRILEPEREQLKKVQGKLWFTLFPELRNRTRGHGATKAEAYRNLCPLLRKSLSVFADNFSLFSREWAFLHRNLSGKYRVVPLSSTSSTFDSLKKVGSNAISPLFDGVYIFANKPLMVELVHTDASFQDFYLPNGKFNSKEFSAISYLTDTTIQIDATPYLASPGQLPLSHTQGGMTLHAEGNCFSNVPIMHSSYVRRQVLEGELHHALVGEMPTVVTLAGRGGIGKTSLAQAAAGALCSEQRFDAILWFSSRDVDLLMDGPKLVQPHLLNKRDVAKQHRKLLAEYVNLDEKLDDLKLLSDSLQKSPLGGPILYIFDNFETTTDQIGLYKWLYTFVRPPNKVLITTRVREFNGDYSISVFGMTEDEAYVLIDQEAKRLDIQGLLTNEVMLQLFQESDGHPYILRILLGEIARTKKVEKGEIRIASKDEVLDALFDRTFKNLSPAAKQVFLTLCSWRSAIPVVALEAVMIRSANESLDVRKAIDELDRSSLVEIDRPDEEQEVATVPLAAAIFGRRKLKASPLKSAVEADKELLLLFGPGQKGDSAQALNVRIQRFVQGIARKSGGSYEKLKTYTPVIEHLSRNHEDAWLLLSRLYRECQPPEHDEAKDAIRRFLESDSASHDKRRAAWASLTQLCRDTSDVVGEMHALVELCEVPATSISTISASLNRWNEIAGQTPLATDEKQILAKQLFAIVEERVNELNATDCSRVAWLCRGVRDVTKALSYAERGLALDSTNYHCQNFIERFSFQS
jgi:hypothetical protein